MGFMCLLVVGCGGVLRVVFWGLCCRVFGISLVGLVNNAYVCMGCDFVDLLVDIDVLEVFFVCVFLGLVWVGFGVVAFCWL